MNEHDADGRDASTGGPDAEQPADLEPWRSDDLSSGAGLPRDAEHDVLPPRLLRLTRTGTVVFSIGLVLVVGVFALAAFSIPRGPEGFEEPVATTERVFERDLHIVDALDAYLPEPVIAAFFWGDRDTVLQLAIEALEEAAKAEPRAEAAGRATARVAVLLGESGTPEEGLRRIEADDRIADRDELLEVYATAYGMASEETSLAHGAIDKAIGTLARRFDDAFRAVTARPVEDQSALFLDEGAAGDSWTACRLAERLLSVPGVPGRASLEAFVIAGREDARRRARRLAAFLAAFTLALVAGVAIALAWLVRWRVPRCGVALLPPPWSFTDGYAAFVRIAVLSAASMFGIAGVVFAMDAVDPWPTAFLALIYPLAGAIFLAYTSLALVPKTLSIGPTLGLTRPPDPASWRTLVVAILAFFSLGQIGSGVIYALVGDGSEWAEGVAEEILHGGGITRAIWYFDTVVSAPVVEELVCRGLIYATLRARFSVFPSAVVSALVFTLPHLYSLPGLLVILWTGLVLALAYERTRSLLVSIAVHAAHNFVICVQFELSYS